MKNKVHFADTGKITIALRTNLIALVASVRVFQNLSAVEERPRRTADERAAMRNLNFPSPPSMSADIQEINQGSDLGALAKDERSAMRNLQFPSVPPTSPETGNPSSTSAIGITASSHDGRKPADSRETLRNAFQRRRSGSPMPVSDVRLSMISCRHSTLSNRTPCRMFPHQILRWKWIPWTRGRMISRGFRGW